MSSRRSRSGGSRRCDHVQAVIQVLTEAASRTRVEQFDVGGGDDADVHLDLFGAAQRA